MVINTTELYKTFAQARAHSSQWMPVTSDATAINVTEFAEDLCLSGLRCCLHANSLSGASYMQDNVLIQLNIMFFDWMECIA